MIVPALKLKCTKCGHEWVPQKREIHLCANCKTPLSKNKPKVVIEGDLDNFEVIEKSD